MPGISTSNILQPAAVSKAALDLQLMTDLQIVSPKTWSMFVRKYGNQNYTWFLSTFGGMEKVEGQSFFWFEERGKLMVAITNKTAVVAPAAGATVTVTPIVGDHFDSGTLSPLRVGETVRVASSGIEGKILTVDTSTPNAHFCTIRPLKSTLAFVSAGSANLLANDVLQFVGDTEAGEASDHINPLLPLDLKVTNSTTEIRDSWTATDRAQMEKVYYDFSDSDMINGINTSGFSAYTFRSLYATNKRYLNNIDFKLIKGDTQTNTGLNAGTLGTQGLIPAIRERGITSTYTPGSMDIAFIHGVSRQAKVNGAAPQMQWLMDIFQRAEFSDELFSIYNAGSFVYGTGSASEEASVAYGFQSLRIDGFVYQVKEAGDLFNTEIVYGKTPATDEFRNFGIILPQGEVRDAKTANKMKNVTVMYQEPPVGGTIGNGIRVWPWGGGSDNPTNGKMTNNVEMLTYRGLRAAGINQFQIVTGGS